MGQDETARHTNQNAGQPGDALSTHPPAWRAALSSIGDAVILTDAQGIVSFMNPVAEALCGWSNAEGIGKQLIDVFQ
jgi:PAS domain S-box-containing protein